MAQQNKVAVDNSGPPRVIPEVAHDITHLTIGLDPDCCEAVGCDWAAHMHSDTNSQKMEPKVRPSSRPRTTSNFRPPKHGHSQRLCHVPHRMTLQVFFANERTFISWLSMAVNLASISIGIIAFSKKDSKGYLFALSLLPVALMFICYALA